MRMLTQKNNIANRLKIKIFIHLQGDELTQNPKYRKNSPHCTTLELFAQELYEKIVDINDYKTFSLIENFKSDSRKEGI